MSCLQCLTFSTLSMSLWAQAGLFQPALCSLCKGPEHIPSQHSPLHQTQPCSPSDSPPVAYPTCSARVMFCKRGGEWKQGEANVNQQIEVEAPVWHWGTAVHMQLLLSLSISTTFVALLKVDQVLGGSAGFSWCYLEKEASLPCGDLLSFNENFYGK